MIFHLSVVFIEASSIVLFFLAIRQALAREKQKALELAMAFVYGLILEELNIFFFRTYHYSPAFLIQVGRAPVAIALLWSVILASSMAISDRLGIPAWAKPCADALAALLIDIAVDAVAIRLGYWTWQIPLSAGWFGVPAGNLYSWLWVVWSYSLLTRAVRALAERDPGRRAYQWLVPAAAYLLLFTEIHLVGLASFKLGLMDESERLQIFYAHVFAFAAVVCVSLLAPSSKGTVPPKGDSPLKRGQVIGRERGEPVPPVLMGSRLAIHAYFIGGLFVSGMVSQAPALAGVALSALGTEILLARRCR